MMEWFTSWTAWHWLVLGLVLLIAEILISGVFILWWGLAALVVAAVVAIFPQLNLTALFILYGLLALSLSLIWWKFQSKKDNTDHSSYKLNQRDHAMLGTVGYVEEIAENGIGRGHFGDTTWRIQGQQLAVGDVIEVIAVEGITLKVMKSTKA